MIELMHSAPGRCVFGSKQAMRLGLTAHRCRKSQCWDQWHHLLHDHKNPRRQPHFNWRRTLATQNGSFHLLMLTYCALRNLLYIFAPYSGLVLCHEAVNHPAFELLCRGVNYNSHWAWPRPLPHALPGPDYGFGLRLDRARS